MLTCSQYIDEIALKFPTLKIIGGHIGFPWTQEMIGVAWKHPNVFIDTSAYLPKYYPPVTPPLPFFSKENSVQANSVSDVLWTGRIGIDTVRQYHWSEESHVWYKFPATKLEGVY